MNILAIGLNHKTAPLKMRERLTFRRKDLRGALKKLLSYKHLREGVILSTCNRVEIYAVSHDLNVGKESLEQFLEEYHRIRFEELRDKVYLYSQSEAVAHLFRVASSLDSLIVGEVQILSQVKSAYEEARQIRAAGKILNSLFQRAFRVAKHVRTNTDIGRGAVSISSVAVELVSKILGNLSGKRVMILGAGKISQITAGCLSSKGATSVLVSNRTFSRAKKLAKAFGGRAVRFDQLLNEMVSSDIVISSTGAPHYVIREDDVLKIMLTRGEMPIFFIDIAVPRDIQPEVGQIKGVHLYNIDDLKLVAEENLKMRQEEVERASYIIEKEVGKFMRHLNSQQAIPLVKGLKERAEKVCGKELERSLPRFNRLSGSEREEIAYLVHRLANQLLHNPINCLKKQAQGGNGQLYREVAGELFGLSEKEVDEEEEQLSGCT